MKRIYKPIITDKQYANLSVLRTNNSRWASLKVNRLQDTIRIAIVDVLYRAAHSTICSSEYIPIMEVV